MTTKSSIKIFRRRVFCIFLAIFMAFLPVITFSYDAHANMTIDDADRELYSQNNIQLTEPCKGGGHNISGNCGGEVTGEDSESRLKSAVEGYGVVAMNLQIEYGVPWELVFAQMVMESQVGFASNGVNASVEANGYYNWLGMMFSDNHFYSVPEAYQSPNGRSWSQYESVQDMIGGYVIDYMRNGIYADAFQYTDPNNFNIKEFFFSEIQHYCPASDGCDHQSYWSAVSKSIEWADEVAAEKGWPTSAELAKEQNIPIGGNWPDINTNIHKQIDAEPHSLHIDCNGGSISAGGAVGTSNGSYTGDGSDITWIGDSITVYTHDTYNVVTEKLPKADIYRQVSKSWWEEGTGSDPKDNGGGKSGLTILKELKEQNKLREVLVFALGTNNGGSMKVTQAHMDEMLELADKCKRIVILTNYHTSAMSKYDSNNALFKKTAEENEKVVLADWKEEASKDSAKYMGDVVHPTKEGAILFRDLILSALGYSENDKSNSNCDCDEKSLVQIDGGLTDEQGQKIIDFYKDTNNDSLWTVSASTKWNCVSMSTFFVQLFTDIGGQSALTGGSKKDCIACKNGKFVVDGLKELGIETGEEPRPFSIFGVSTGRTMCGAELCGHTGVVIAVDGDEVTTLEASYGDTGYAAVVKRQKSYFVNTSAEKFAYLGDHLDVEALSQVLGESIGTTTGGGVASSNIQWSDGWITGGLDGYVKEAPDHTNDNAHNGSFSTDMPKGGKGPNKITLHSTEGTNGSGNSGLEIYYTNLYPAHFTIDLKQKKVYQHFSILKPADAVASHDNTAGVQIEIMGFSTSDRSNQPWYLYNKDNFGDDEWGYLAKVLAGISNETGIPLTTNVDWENPSRLSVSEYASYEGILGHMHVPDNDHGDPGNLWPILSKALGNIDSTGNCDPGNTWTGDFPWWMQCDEKWASHGWGSCGDICHSGCGVVSFAMMATALTGKEILPTEVADYSGDYHVCNPDGGSKHSLPAGIADHFGLQAEAISDYKSEEAINSKLKDGWMVWTCGRGALPFSDNGHCIGIRALTSDGKWLLADSSGRVEKDQAFEPSVVLANMNTGTALKKK